MSWFAAILAKISDIWAILSSNWAFLANFSEKSMRFINFREQNDKFREEVGNFVSKQRHNSGQLGRRMVPQVKSSGKSLIFVSRNLKPFALVFWLDWFFFIRAVYSVLWLSVERLVVCCSLSKWMCFYFGHSWYVSAHFERKRSFLAKSMCIHHFSLFKRYSSNRRIPGTNFINEISVPH